MEAMKEFPFDYTVLRKPRRKTATITVSTDNRVTVSVPSYVTDGYVREILRRKAAWIQGRIEANLARLEHCKPKRFESGEEHRYRGVPLLLIVEEGAPCRPRLEEGRLRIRAPSGLSSESRGESVKAQLVAWYRERAMEELKGRVRFYEARLGVRAAEIRVKSLKSRWGSCSSRGSISFNWQLILAPDEIMDYVIVHELCHLVHLNHSPDFWKLVESVVPDCRQRRQWLRKSGCFWP